MKPVLNQLNLVVRDMHAMVGFYERLGLDIGASMGEWAPHHRKAADPGGLDVDFDSTAFASVWNGGWPAGQTGIVLGFTIESRAGVDALFEELVGAGYAAQQEPYDAFWGARFAVVVDPDGNSVGLMSDVDPSYKSAPPQLPDPS